MSDDPKISQRYRELPREEPPAHLDEAILAAGRRAVAPSGPRRWYVPVAAAAIIVLVVAVTLRVEREQPDAEAPVAAAPAPTPREEPRVMQAPPPAAPAPAPSPPPPPRAAMKSFVPDPQPQLADSVAQGREDYERRAAAADLARLQAEAERPRSERQAQALAQRESAEEPRRKLRSGGVPASPDGMQESGSRPAAAASAIGTARYESPEQWLLGIDDLKRQRRHQEAEKQLAEFRKRYPGYRIPEAILQRFEYER